MYNSFGKFKPLSGGFRRLSFSRITVGNLVSGWQAKGWSASGLRWCSAGTTAAPKPSNLNDMLTAISERKGAAKMLRTSTVASQVSEPARDLLQRLRTDAFRAGALYVDTFVQFLDSVQPDDKISDQDAAFLISCCGNALPECPTNRRLELLNRLLTMLPSHGVKFGLEHFNEQLRVYKENEVPFSPNEFIERMKADGVAPGQTTFELLVSCCATRGDIEQATQLLSMMKEMQMPITERTFASLIYAYLKIKDESGASSVAEVMKSRNIRPGNLTYTAKLLAYAESGNAERIKETFDEASAAGIFLSDEDLLEMIIVLCRHGHDGLVDKVFSELRRQMGYVMMAKRASLRLVTLGHYDAAFKVLQSMANINQSSATGDRLLKHMVQTAPIDAIFDMCQRMEEAGVHHQAYTSALRSALLASKFDMTEGILRHMSFVNAELRPQYFWPVLCMKGATQEHAVRTLELMQELNVPITMITLVDWFWRNSGVACDALINSQAGGKLGANFLRVSYLCHLMKHNDAEAVLEYANRTRFTLLSHRKVLDCLYELFRRDQRLETAVAVLARLNSSLGTEMSAQDFNSMLLRRLINAMASDSLNVVLENMLQRQLLVEQDILDTVKKDEKLSERLRELSVSQTSAEHAPDSADSLIADFKTGGRDVSIRAERLLRQTLAEGNYEESVKLHNFLRDNYRSSSVIFDRQMVLLCLNSKRLDEAKQRLDGMEKDLNITMKLASALIAEKRFADAVELLKSYKSATGRVNAKAAAADLNSMLTMAAENGSVKDVCDLVGVLFDLGFATSSNALLSKCSRLYIEKNELDKAVEFFDVCCTRFRRVPFSLDLLMALIKNENSTLLQRVYELLVERKGELHAWTMVSLALASAGRTDQAKQLLEKRGRMDSTLLTAFCRTRVLTNKPAQLESLLKVTQSMTEVSRDLLYCYLLMIFRNSKNWRRALKTWNAMKSEQFKPSVRVLCLLDRIFAECGKHMPDDLQEAVDRDMHSNGEQSEREILSAIYTTLPSCEVNALLNQKDVQGATELYLQLVSDGQVMPISLTRQLFAKLRDDKNYSAMSKLRASITSSDAMAINANYMLTETMIRSGQTERYLQPLEANVHMKTSPALLATVLDCHPEMEERIQAYANSAQVVGNKIPKTAMWMYYMACGRQQDAEAVLKEIGEEALAKHGRYNYVIEKAIKTNLEDAANSMISFVEKHQSSQLSLAVGLAVRICCSQGNTKLAEEMVKFAEKAGCTDSKVYRNAVGRLKRLQQADKNEEEGLLSEDDDDSDDEIVLDKEASKFMKA